VAERATFYGLLREAVLHPITGWDFRWLEGRRVTRGEFPWNYTEKVRELARDSPDLLDLGTGGGEWLAQLEPRPPRTVATESYRPNVPVARARLAPLGVSVVWTKDTGSNASFERTPPSSRLPFGDGTFHLVTCRHDAYVPAEVHRLLAPGGRFITQQVGDGVGDEWYQLFRRKPPPSPDPPWDLPLALRQIERVGLDVVGSGEGSYETVFLDVGAVVWYLRAVPWALPGFSVDRDVVRLREIHERIRREGELTVRMPGFWLEARRPPGRPAPRKRARGPSRARTRPRGSRRRPRR
jgi:SAM-dependent methyltransferase